MTIPESRWWKRIKRRLMEQNGSTSPTNDQALKLLPSIDPKTTAEAPAKDAPNPHVSGNATEHPDEGRVPTTGSWTSVRRLIEAFSTEKWGMLLVFVLVLASVALTVWAPVLLGRAIDLIFRGVMSAPSREASTSESDLEGTQEQGSTQTADEVSGVGFVPGHGSDLDELARLILSVLTIYIVAQLLMWLHGRMLNDIVMRVVFRLRQNIEKKVNRLPLAYFDTRKRGDVLSRTTNDVDNVQAALQQAFAVLVPSSLITIGISCMMFWLSWEMALIALVAIPLSAVFVLIIGSRSEKLFTIQWKTIGKLNGHIEESFTGHEVVTAFNRHSYLEERFDRYNQDLFEASFKAQFYSGLIMPTMQFISYLVYVGIAVVGALRVASGQMTLGSVTAFIQFSREFNQTLNEVAGVSNMLISGVTSARRVFELLDAKEEDPDVQQSSEGKQATVRPPVSAGVSTPARGKVEFDRVSFSYTSKKVLIDDLSLTVQPGQTVAIVGPTGAGKTTLVNLIMRFYEVQSGRIVLDGVDTQTMHRQTLRSQIGMVLQDASLFSGTIRENIRYGRLNATDEEVVSAARVTLVDRFVRTLPHGYDTVIEGQGTNISAGEKQLITIARAFLADPVLLILDEATSSVDTRTEILIQKALAALRAHRTVFVIAHRLATVRDADVIVVMDHGEVVEYGSHADLMRTNGMYYRLHVAQSESPETVSVRSFVGWDGHAKACADNYPSGIEVVTTLSNDKLVGPLVPSQSKVD